MNLAEQLQSIVREHEYVKANKLEQKKQELFERIKERCIVKAQESKHYLLYTLWEAGKNVYFSYSDAAKIAPELAKMFADQGIHSKSEVGEVYIWLTLDWKEEKCS